MRRILANVAILATLAGCGPITTPDGWIIPNLAHETRCQRGDGVTLCTDRVTGERYRDGVHV